MASNCNIEEEDRGSEKTRGQMAGICSSTKQAENLIDAVFGFWNTTAGQALRHGEGSTHCISPILQNFKKLIEELFDFWRTSMDQGLTEEFYKHKLVEELASCYDHESSRVVRLESEVQNWQDVKNYLLDTNSNNLVSEEELRKLCSGDDELNHLNILAHIQKELKQRAETSMKSDNATVALQRVATDQPPEAPCNEQLVVLVEGQITEEVALECPNNQTRAESDPTPLNSSQSRFTINNKFEVVSLVRRNGAGDFKTPQKNSMRTLTRRSRRMTGTPLENPFKYPFCKFAGCKLGFYKEVELRSHYKKKHNLDFDGCPLPRSHLEIESHLAMLKREEMQSASTKCAICRRQFRTVEEVLAHQSDTHVPDTFKAYACSRCTKKFVMPKQITSHHCQDQ